MSATYATRRYKTLYIIFSILSLLTSLGPLIGYTIAGLCSDSLVVYKVGLTCTIVLAILFTVINLLMKYHIRSALWVLILGISLCLESITTMLIWVAVGTILDEFILSPLKKRFKEKTSINVELDKRGLQS